ncbi:hypothetical protein CUMW_243100 [Citrus unshiu]|uniref:Uncharacterized protein n=2 Tax=Citrus TaxID=2706 RepID=A0A067DLX7_CITSI|nr:hypothetical protein CISIN_1g044009mg [Citrus sinensis]GAY65694.1 hypothetical protein CUMW_243100 [Citrus unshiu]
MHHNMINENGFKDWKDLWQPKLAGRISMVNSPREVIGTVLKYMGVSYNSNDIGRIAVQQNLALLGNQYLPDLNRSDSPSRLSYPTPHLRVSDKQCSIKAIRLSRSRIDQRLTMTDNLSVSITSSLFNSLLLPPTLSRIRSPYMLSWSHKAPSHSSCQPTRPIALSRHRTKRG